MAHAEYGKVGAVRHYAIPLLRDLKARALEWEQTDGTQFFSCQDDELKEWKSPPRLEAKWYALARKVRGRRRVAQAAGATRAVRSLQPTTGQIYPECGRAYCMQPSGRRFIVEYEFHVPHSTRGFIQLQWLEPPRPAGLP